MKKINLLAFTALLCAHFGAQAAAVLEEIASAVQASAVQASGNLSGVGTPITTGTSSTTDSASTDTAGQTYTFTYVAPTGDLSTPFSFSVSASVPSLSDLAKGLQNLITSIPATKLYVYNGAGKYVAPLNLLPSLNSSWMPAASSQASTFFVSTASNLSVDQILTAEDGAVDASEAAGQN